MNNPRTRRTDEFLLQRRTILISLVGAIDEVLDGASLASACKQRGLKYGRVSNFLTQKKLDMFFLEELVPIADAVIQEKDPIESLYCDIFGEDAFARSELPYDAADTVNAVLDGLTERERKILHYRYGFDGEPPMLLDEVGQIFGVTRDRIRQIEAKAVRKLRHPSRKRLLLKGLAISAAEDEAAKKEAEAKAEAIKAKAEVRIADIRNAINCPLEQEENAELGTIDKAIAAWKHQDIAELYLSVRTYNCLWRNGVMYLLDAFALTDEEMMNIRNMGRKSVQELNRRLDYILQPYEITRGELRNIIRGMEG